MRNLSLVGMVLACATASADAQNKVRVINKPDEPVPVAVIVGPEQSPIPITGTVQTNLSIPNPLPVTGIVQASLPNPLPITGSVQATIVGTPLPVTGTVAVEEPVTVEGTIGVSGPVSVTGSVSVTTSTPLPVKGTVAVEEPITVEGTVGISGPVSVTGTPLPPIFAKGKTAKMMEVNYNAIIEIQKVQGDWVCGKIQGGITVWANVVALSTADDGAVVWVGGCDG